MFAMIVLLALCFRAATIAVSMAIDRPETIGAASACGPKRSGGCQAGDFLASRGMAAQPPGEESRTTALRLVDRGVAGLRPDQAINETEWCALPGTEKSEENPATIISPRPQTGAARKSFPLLEPLTPVFRNGNENAAAHRFWRASIGPLAPIAPPPSVDPSAHDARMRAPPLLRPKLGKNERARRISQIMSRQEATTVPVFQGPPKQRSGMPPAVSTPLR
jgi:hypothetical protein